MGPDQHSNDLAGFLRARRTQVTPQQVGLPTGPGHRRTPGLRREELATLAGVSIDYYTRLERGKETRPSPAVVDSLARALHLQDDEHEHLRRLAARAARTAPEPQAGTDPDAPDLAQLVGELLLKSDDFARLRERHDVRAHRPGTKHFHHPQVGDLTLGYQSMPLENTPGHRLVVYYADTTSPDHDAMVLLDMLSTPHTPEPADQADAPAHDRRPGAGRR
ncbi:helix-turn-helix transcriptional regulator [Streptomyces sp. NRRL S-813]|uniref:helix-turn-helix transcriptional regulator n=1 Tax=Streptomyces sp. NRRL S-813 TaxID=1463919 RepID=UPI0004BF5131|nr:helix-turn-helix transcriptional regulator [Streptomyces sp. NRRL S-813]